MHRNVAARVIVRWGWGGARGGGGGEGRYKDRNYHERMSLFTTTVITVAAIEWSLNGQLSHDE
jgi:hypothetical protein